MAEVPFADEGGGVAGRFQAGGQENFGLGNALGVVRKRVLRVVLVTEALLHAARHEGGAGRAAIRVRDVTGGEAHAIVSEAIDVRGFEVGAAVEPDVAVTLIIGHDDDDVGFVRSEE